MGGPLLVAINHSLQSISIEQTNNEFTIKKILLNNVTYPHILLRFVTLWFWANKVAGRSRSHPFYSLHAKAPKWPAEDALTEVPDYLLERSRERRAALELETNSDGDVAAQATGASEIEATGATAAVPSPVAVPEIQTIESPKPVAPWVQAAQERKKIPVWMAPVALFLPIWGFMIWGTLEEPTRDTEGPIAAGQAIYENGCATCHGAGGGGGVGYQLNDGEVLLTFPDVESHVAWVINGTSNTGPTYGDPERLGGQRETGALGNMPSFASLSSIEVLEVVLYERSVHGLASNEQLEPYLMWVENGELPSWETGVTAQEISRSFQNFVNSNEAAKNAMEEFQTGINN